MKFNELVDGKEYIGIGSDGKEYKGTFVNDYVPGGVFFCILPSQNIQIVEYKEITH